jgi:hypothetical protein
VWTRERRDAHTRTINPHEKNAPNEGARTDESEEHDAFNSDRRAVIKRRHGLSFIYEGDTRHRRDPRLNSKSAENTAIDRDKKGRGKREKRTQRGGGREIHCAVRELGWKRNHPRENKGTDRKKRKRVTRGIREPPRR